MFMASISAVGSFPKRLPSNPVAVSPSPPSSCQRIICRSSTDPLTSFEGGGRLEHSPLIDRRQVVLSSIAFLAANFFSSRNGETSAAADFAEMPALRGKDYGKTKMRYLDYTETNSGPQYKDLRAGNGPSPKIGETVVDHSPPELGYPENYFNKKGPRPTTFSGQRALDFVLRNQGLIDKTLLFDIELLKIV